MDQNNMVIPNWTTLVEFDELKARKIALDAGVALSS
jgi:hypothetical protein